MYGIQPQHVKALDKLLAQHKEAYEEERGRRDAAEMEVLAREWEAAKGVGGSMPIQRRHRLARLAGDAMVLTLKEGERGNVCIRVSFGGLATHVYGIQPQHVEALDKLLAQHKEAYQDCL